MVSILILRVKFTVSFDFLSIFVSFLFTESEFIFIYESTYVCTYFNFSNDKVLWVWMYVHGYKYAVFIYFISNLIWFKCYICMCMLCSVQYACVVYYIMDVFVCMCFSFKHFRNKLSSQVERKQMIILISTIQLLCVSMCVCVI